ncbi:MAG: hypothetical protein ABSE27_05680 [Acidobacteriaceae bacterium]|jgi:hypothetical protein
MKRFACMVLLLLSPGLLPAAPAADAPSTTGLWKIEGSMMGQPVRMMCALTETKHNLSGVCSGAEDGYAAHKVAGSVKAQKMQFYFQTAIGGNPLTLIVSGTLNQDFTKMDGDLDVEPMAVGGLFSAIKELEHDTASAQANAAAAQTDAAAAQAWAAEVQAHLATGNEAATGAGAAVAGATESNPSSAQPIATGTWKIDGNVMGNPVTMTCVLTEAEHKLAGTCTGAGEDRTPRTLTGTATPKGVNWRFDDQFQGQPISFSINATMSADGAKMNGTLSIAPMNVGGDFVATKQ